MGTADFSLQKHYIAYEFMLPCHVQKNHWTDQRYCKEYFLLQSYHRLLHLLRTYGHGLIARYSYAYKSKISQTFLIWLPSISSTLFTKTSYIILKKLDILFMNTPCLSFISLSTIY